MSKLLRPQDRLLLGMALLADVFDEVRDVGGLVSASYKQVYGFVPNQYKKRNFANVVSRNLRTGNIEKILKGDEIFFRLTSEGKSKIQRDFPLVALRDRRWDKVWRIVVFDIPQKQAYLRNNLRKKLKQLGFGMLQESIWVSPHNIVADLREFLIALQIEEMVFVLEAKSIADFDDRELANKIFHLDTLNKEYKDLIENQHGKLEEKRDLKRLYLQIFLKDPLLPKELLPNGWLEEKARKAVLF